MPDMLVVARRMANILKSMNQLLLRVPLQRSSPTASFVPRECGLVVAEAGALARRGRCLGGPSAPKRFPPMFATEPNPP